MPEPIRFTDADAYDRSMGAWSDLVGRQFLAWVAPPAGLAWADIGCGTGSFTRLLAECAAPSRIDAIDPSDIQLTHARARGAARPAEFHRGDAMALPFAAAQFDAAAMALVLFFVPEPARGVAEMRRVVRSGGLVCAYVWDLQGGGTPAEPFWAALRAFGVPPMEPPRPDAAPLAALDALWRQAGLEAVATRTITVTREFDDFESWWRNGLDLPPVGPSVAALAPADASALKDRLRTQVAAGEDGRLRATARAHAVTGRVPAG